MMLINHKKKYIYIHIPKTAGESIASILVDDGARRLGDKHNTINQVEKFVKSAKDYYIFSVVRNPFEQAVSFYEHLRKPLYKSYDELKSQYPEYDGLLYPKKECQSAMKLSFPDWCKAVYAETNTCHWFHDYNCFLDFKTSSISQVNVFKFEEIFKLEKVLEVNFGIHEKLPRLNESKKSKNIKHYYDSKTLDIVTNNFSDSLQKFEYEFPNNLVIRNDTRPLHIRLLEPLKSIYNRCIKSRLSE